MSEQELKACPFCGNKAEEPDNEVSGLSSISWWVMCSHCSAKSEDWGTEEMAIKAWNDRTDTQEVEQLRKELEEYKDSVFQYGIECTKLTLERDELTAANAEKMKTVLDAIYNHNEAARAAVIQHYGLHHQEPAQSLAEHDKRVRDEVIEECADIVGCFENDLRDNENWEWFDDTTMQIAEAIRALKSKP